MCALASFSLVLSMAAESSAPAGGNDKQFSCIIHVHSKLSGEGTYTLPELTDVARSYKIDAIFLTDNLTYTLTYGLPPLRQIFWVNYSLGSVLKVGAAEYLKRIEAENKRQSEVLYIPGVEVCPRFYWVGSILETNLVCHDNQRNLMILGVYDKKIIRGIPESCGYLWGRNPGWIILSRAVLLLFLFACVGYFFLPRILAEKSGYNRGIIRRAFVIGLIFPSLVLMLTVNILASFVPSLQIYGRNEDHRHESRTLRYIEKNDLVSYWAHPEAFDDQDFSRYRFHIRTDPYPNLLMATSGYSGFGGVYEDKNTLIDPGAEWDGLLMDYINGKRAKPVWSFGEMLYHYEGQAGKKLGNIETVVWAKEKTADALLASIRNGKFYSRQNSSGQSLMLDKWMIRSTGNGGREVFAAITSRVPGEGVNIQLICNGQVIKKVADATTPVELSLPVVPANDSSNLYYRLMVAGKTPLRLVSNPLFILQSRR